MWRRGCNQRTETYTNVYGTYFGSRTVTVNTSKRTPKLRKQKRKGRPDLAYVELARHTSARESEPVRPVPDEHVDAIRPFVSRQIGAMIELQRLTGMRSGEVAAMRGRDIDMAGKLWTYRPDQHKSKHRGHTRVVELGPRAQGVIRPFLRSELDAFLFSPQDATRERHAEAPTHRREDQKPNPRKTDREIGDHYTSASYRRAIQRACDRADISKWHPHQLRHLAATRLRKQDGIEPARLLLGHTSIVTAAIYAEVDRAKAQELVAKIG